MGADYVPRAIEALTKMGYQADRAECRNQYRSRDLYGFADVIGIRCQPDQFCQAPLHVILLQVTSTSHVADRRKKVQELAKPFAHPCIHIEVWGYKGKELKRREQLRNGDTDVFTTMVRTQ